MAAFPVLAEALALRMAVAVPRPLMRVLAGRPVSAEGQTLDLETQWMLRLKEIARRPHVESVPVQRGRAVIARESALAGGRLRIGSVEELEVPGGDGPLRARLYVPRSRAGSAGSSPLLVFLHGGGLMYGDLDSHDASCRLIAERADARVLAVDYRLAPEHPYPAAVEDSWAAYSWAVGNADRLGADPDRIGVGGDSAGGYLSAVVALRAAQQGVACRFQLLVYPVTNMADSSASRRTYRQGFYLTEGFIDLSVECYLSGGGDPRDPEVSVAFTEELPAGLAPALVVTAGFDPLRDEGEAWARRLADAGVGVELRRYPELVHGFFNVVGVGSSQRAAVAEIAALTRAALHS